MFFYATLIKIQCLIDSLHIQVANGLAISNHLNKPETLLLAVLKSTSLKTELCFTSVGTISY